MFRIESKISTSNPEFKENHAYYTDKLREFRERLAAVKSGGPPRSIERHHKRGKLTARERLQKLFDRNTPFLEFSALAANGMYNDEAPAAGVVTGVGLSVQVAAMPRALPVSRGMPPKPSRYAPSVIEVHAGLPSAWRLSADPNTQWAPGRDPPRSPR